ncbi:MAG TPA: MEDS domain-containing protein [Gemmatimonadales bacterium]|nr:MEDS domain-containing protein [Gemmatimonadales bacterium]
MALLAEAPAGRHFAQFHRTSDSLTESIYAFLEGGIRRSNSVIVIGTPELRDRLTTRLAEEKFHPQTLVYSGRLDLIDAAELMAAFLPDGVPEWPRFRSVMVPILSRIQGFGRRTRVFVEMGSILWREGNTAGAVQLENLWNTLAGLHTFALYCGYTLDTQREESYTGPLEEVGHAHTDILGADDDEQFGVALDRASKEIFGITLSQMAGMTNHDGARRFPSGQRTMLWVKRNLPLSTALLAERARRYFQELRT